MKFGCNLIGGLWRDSQQMEPTRNPSDLAEVPGQFAWATIEDAADALAAARAAQPGWARTTVQERADLLFRVADRLDARRAELALILASEEGKVLADATGEVLRSAQIFRYFAGEALRINGAFLPGLREGHMVSVEREPVGVVLLITPWNFPLVVPAWKTAAALAYGNSLILKPSEFAPGIALALVEIMAEAGAPEGVVNLLMGDGRLFGEMLIEGVDAVSFTGSTGVGRTILAQAAPSMTKVQLELGGKNALVVLDDADLDLAVEVALQGSFFQTGQRCTASSRLIVTTGIHDAFADSLARRTSALRVGHALASDSQIGPVANDRQLERNLAFVESASADGAQMIAGGEPIAVKSEGLYMRPTLFAGTRPEMKLNREEVFGPVAGLIEVADLDEAIAVANDTEFALSSGICTRSLHAAEQFRRSVRAGMVMINAPTAGVDYHVPFGGKAPSGYGGRENGAAAIEFYTETKTTYHSHGGG